VTLKNILGRVTSYLDDGAGWSSLLIVPVFLLSWIKYPAAASRGAKLFSVSRCSESSGQGVRIASYNIHRAKGMDRIRDLGRIADNLKGVDLAALQEVSGPQGLGGGGVRPVNWPGGWLWAGYLPQPDTVPSSHDRR